MTGRGLVRQNRDSRTRTGHTVEQYDGITGYHRPARRGLIRKPAALFYLPMMADYVKNYHVLYTHYRQPMGGDPLPLLEPEHHILYLDMCWQGKQGLQFTLAELAFRMRVSVRTLVERIDRLGNVELISFPYGPRYTEERPDDPIVMPRQPEGGDAGQEFDKDYDVLHEFYRHSFGGREPLLTPLRHMLYLDLQTLSATGTPATLDEIRKTYGQKLSRKEVVRWLAYLKAVDLLECGDPGRISFIEPFEFRVRVPYTEEELRAGKREEITGRAGRA